MKPHLWVPDTIFGVDSDEALAYITTKQVWIRDRRIGLGYYAIVSAILIWVVGGQILWRNEHFLKKDVTGIRRMTYSHPTKNGCDPTDADCESKYKPFESLPYCNQYKGTLWYGHGDCAHEDRVSAIPGGSTDNKLFFPTAVEFIPENLIDGEYKPEEGSDCLQPGSLCQKRGNRSGMFHYIADLKSFTLQFTSTYRRDGIRGTSLELPGFYYACKALLTKHKKVKLWSERLATNDVDCVSSSTRVEIPCQPGLKCERLQDFDVFETTGLKETLNKTVEKLRFKPRPQSGVGFLGTIPHSRAAEDGQGKPAATEDWDLDQYQNRWGDVFKIGRLMQLAGADLDNDYNVDGWTSRQAGTVLEVTIEYDNLYPFLSSFGYTPVRYTYRVQEQVMPYVSKMQLAEVQPAEYPAKRLYEVRHGVLVVFRVGGTFGFFNVVYFLLMLSTAFALISAATTITDLAARQWVPNFFHLKYEVSPDFSDLWICPKCRFGNLKQHSTCEGVGMWKCAATSEKCGMPRPQNIEDA